eukprot:6388275-Heterocapsa_arctica.AAC.1
MQAEQASVRPHASWKARNSRAAARRSAGCSIGSYNLLGTRVASAAGAGGPSIRGPGASPVGPW